MDEEGQKYKVAYCSDRVRARTGWPCVTVLWLDECDSTCNCLSRSVPEITSVLFALQTLDKRKSQLPLTVSTHKPVHCSDSFTANPHPPQRPHPPDNWSNCRFQRCCDTDPVTLVEALSWVCPQTLLSQNGYLRHGRSQLDIFLVEQR